MARKALLSVFNKDGIVDFAKSLSGLGWEFISTGGTYKALSEANIPVVEVTQVTGFPEIMDGRVKTLTPQVHAGLLARRDNPEDMKTLKELNIETIDMVVVNLYPFFEKVKDDSLSFEEKIEFIDIGGPTMLRSSAKNFKDVIVVVDPEDYSKVLSELSAGDLSIETRKYLANKVFSLTSKYDNAISEFLSE